MSVQVYMIRTCSVWSPGCAFTPPALLGSLYRGTNISPSPWLPPFYSLSMSLAFFFLIPHVSRSIVLVFL